MNNQQRMMHKPIHWGWMVPLLLLAVFMVAPRLDWDGPWYDELFSIANAGGLPDAGGIGSVYEKVVQEDPRQALGYPYALGLWGTFTGWTELAARTFSLLSALLAAAITYRFGREFFSPLVGIFSALILLFSTYFLHYAHEVRAFTFIAIFAISTVYFYARLLTEPKISRGAAVGFVLSSAALLYAHYFAAMLAIGLGLYHLIFVKKDSRWLRISGLALIAALLFLPQVQAFLVGIESYTPESVEEAPLSALGALESIVYYISNNAWLPAILLFIAGAWSAWKRPILRMVIFTALFSLAALLIANEILEILEPARLRYAVYLWPLLAIWLGAGMAWLIEWLRVRLDNPALMTAVLLLIPGLWLANGMLAHYTPGFNESIEGDVVPRLRTIANVLRDEGASTDLFAFYNDTSGEAWYIQRGFDYMTSETDMRKMFTGTVYDIVPSNRTWAQSRIEEATRIWYGVNRTIPLTEIHEDFLALLDEEFVFCQNYADDPDISLDLYARSAAYCPGESILQFGDFFTLTGSEIVQSGDDLTLYLGWQQAPDSPRDTYSLGAYLMPAGVTELLVQTDAGFSEDAFVPLELHLDTSSLEPGDYDLWLAVYDWQSGERLPGTYDTQSDTLLRLAVIEVE